ncbi:MAG TPA: small ribosomal subunit Rsm22 family protein [Candidatus Didemnitutus sp.]|nr:small ribosomal subunit Rsm22 family protein [Candidatus Didemnitutus sp.]
MNWQNLDWEVLDRLRATFLGETRLEGPYWHTLTDLECYDLTFGERIGWKWDAVLAELTVRGWTPPDSVDGISVLDWGCGSGIASRRVLKFLAAIKGRLVLHDHSALAVEFSVDRARKSYPDWQVDAATTRDLRGSDRIGILIVSHVLNELDDNGRAELAELIARSETVLWVEPGTHEVSRNLIQWRERLRAEGFHAVAPCPHPGPCGLLTPGNERHWCHHFAEPPTGIYADSGWVRFGQRAGIDLRALPYSFLVLDRRPFAQPEDASRILGQPRLYKGYAKIFNCSASGVEELNLPQRIDKPLFKSLKRPEGPLLYRWTRDGDKITSGVRTTSSDPS